MSKVSFSSRVGAEKKRNCVHEFNTKIKDLATNDAWHSRNDNATFMEYSFWRPLTPLAMGWKLKGASRVPLIPSHRLPAAAVRRRRFRIVVIIVRRPPRGGETVSRGWRPRPWPWRGLAGWRLSSVSQDFHSSPPPFPVLPFAFGRRQRHRRRRCRRRHRHPRSPVAPHSRNFLSNSSITSSSHPAPFPACTLSLSLSLSLPLVDYLKVNRLDGFLAIISFSY